MNERSEDNEFIDVTRTVKYQPLKTGKADKRKPHFILSLETIKKLHRST